MTMNERAVIVEDVQILVAVNVNQVVTTAALYE
jgi:hypothetical protein